MAATLVDPLVRRYVIRKLSDLGYTPIEAADAAEALRIIDTGVTLDLLFTTSSCQGT